MPRRSTKTVEAEPTREAPLASANGYAPDPDFDCWWSVNHPFDWWAKERNGQPLPDGDRLRVWNICRAAWAAAHNND